MRQGITNHIAIGASLAAMLSATVASGAIADSILALTGGKRTRIVWSREVGAVNHAYGTGGTFRLMRFDTDAGTEADVLGTTDEYFRAKITWDGTRIVYNRHADLCVVDFAGGNNRLIGANMAMGCLWHDELTGKEYALAAVGPNCLTAFGDATSEPLYKVNIDDPKDSILIFNNVSYNNIWMSISRDGTKLGGHFPWSSNGGIWDIASHSLLNYGQYG